MWLTDFSNFPTVECDPLDRIRSLPVIPCSNSFRTQNWLFSFFLNYQSWNTTFLKKILVGHNKGIKLTAKAEDEDPAINVRSLEKNNQPKYEEPKTKSPKTTAKLIRTHDVYCFFITVFRLAIPVFFRFTDVTEPMIGITILHRWRMSQ